MEHRWLEPQTLEALRRLVIAGDKDAVRAMRHWHARRKAPAHSATRRFHQRAFSRAATRALERSAA